MAVTLREAFGAFWSVLTDNQRAELLAVAAPDTRECGWMGCGHDACRERCAGTPLASEILAVNRARSEWETNAKKWQRRAERAERTIARIEAYAAALCDCGDTDHCVESAYKRALEELLASEYCNRGPCSNVRDHDGECER